PFELSFCGADDDGFAIDRISRRVQVRYLMALGLKQRPQPVSAAEPTDPHAWCWHRILESFCRFFAASSNSATETVPPRCASLRRRPPRGSPSSVSACLAAGLPASSPPVSHRPACNEPVLNSLGWPSAFFTDSSSVFADCLRHPSAGFLSVLCL